jgi:hypothetical protein
MSLPAGEAPKEPTAPSSGTAPFETLTLSQFELYRHIGGQPDPLFFRTTMMCARDGAGGYWIPWNPSTQWELDPEAPIIKTGPKDESGPSS